MPALDLQPVEDELDLQPVGRQDEFDQADAQKAIESSKPPQVAENLAGAAVEAVKSIPPFIASLPKKALVAAEVASGQKSRTEGLSEILKEAIPMGESQALGLLSPVGSKDFFGAAIQTALLAAPGLELMRGIKAPSLVESLTAKPEIAGSLTERLGLAEKPPVQEIPTDPTAPLTEVAATSVPPVEETKPVASTEAPAVIQEDGLTPETPIAQDETAVQGQMEVPASSGEVKQGFVRIYHGGSAEQAGSDFTTDLQYASDYAAKSGASGKVWYVDIPEGSLKTHDEYGQPMTRVVVPDEIANQAKPLESASQAPKVAESSQPVGVSSTESPSYPNDYTPALRTKQGEVITVENAKGKNHQNIYSAHPEGTELRANEPEHGFIDQKIGEFKTREQVSKDLGETEPMQSERLAELQKAQEPVQPIGAKAATLAERDAAKIITAPPPGEVIGWEKNTANGHALIDQGKADPYEIISKFRQDGKISPENMGIMRAQLEKLQAVTNEAGDALRANQNDPALKESYQRAQENEQSFTDAYKPMHTTASASLASLKGEAPLPVEFAKSYTGLSRAFKEIHQREFTPEESLKAAKITDEAKGAEGKYQNEGKALYNTIDREYGRTRQRLKVSKVPTLEELGKIFKNPLEEVCL